MIQTNSTQHPTPDHNCTLCPRLSEFRSANRASFPQWWNAPVLAWGEKNAQLLIVGLAPGLKGANRTGRPFTADFAGELLYNTLLDHGFAKGSYEARADDSLELQNCRIVNAVRCVPPQNKPVMSEIRTCNYFLKPEIIHNPNLKIILALGTIAHMATLIALNVPLKQHRFHHGQFLSINPQLILANSYHVSRYNTSTGRLTSEMFQKVIKEIRFRLTNQQEI